jgi:hypothetical protein
MDFFGRADAQRREPFERLGLLGAVEIGARLEGRLALADLGDDLARLDVRAPLRPLHLGVDELLHLHLLAPREVLVVVQLGGAKEDEDHGVDLAHVAAGPLQDVGHLVQRLLVHGRVERDGDPAHRGDEIRVLLTQLVGLLLRLAAPPRAALPRVHVERDADEPGALELHEHRPRERLAVRVDDRLAPHSRDFANDLDDLGVHERIAAGDGDPIEVAEVGEGPEIRAHLVHGPVRLDVLAIAAVAGEIALLRGLEPRDGVVGEAPRQAIERAVIDDGILHRRRSYPGCRAPR